MNTSSINRPELLAPAGNRERMETAFRFGADAVYLGANAMSLRNFADNFSDDELTDACSYAHCLGKRVYLACNAFARDEDLAATKSLLSHANRAEVDALIVNDPGVVRLARNICPQIPLHLSTQANTLNTQAALFWHEQGIKRIILARELSLEQIRNIRANAPETLELEMFVHGAMCVSYSGRCLLSNYIAGRDSNRGECVQPCRWSYEMRERGKDGEFFNVEQDERGTYIFNSRDMNLIEHLPEVISTGVCSLKIEGRMKSVSYVATVVNAYKLALDACMEGRPLPEGLLRELECVSHRPYTTGFAFDAHNADIQTPQHAGYISDATICGVVLQYDAAEKRAYIRQRNRFFEGDTLDVLSPGVIGGSFCAKTIINEDGERQESASHPNQRLYIECDYPVKPGDILRKSC